MCYSPTLINIRTNRCDISTGLFHENSSGIKMYKKLRPASGDFLVNKVLVPCGKCAQCLKRRQNDLAARCAIEAKKFGSMIFATLTYREDTLPLAVTLEYFDIDTGELLTRYNGFSSQNNAVGFVPRDSDFYVKCLDSLSRLPKNCVRYVFEDFSPFVDGYRYCVTPSLCRRDVQLWLKSCRVQFKREFGKSLPLFSYVCCGEYGSNPKHSRRPHYHIAFFGLSLHDVQWMCKRWSDKYGFTFVEKVNAINADGSSGFDICARYIGKYMTKGCFEHPAVKDGCSLRPRLMCSKGVGSMSSDKVIDDSLLAYYRCYDVVGEYDVNSGLKKDGSSLTESDFNLIAQNVLKRVVFKIGNSSYPIPHKVKYYVWYTKTSEGSFVSSFVRKKITDIIRVDVFEDFVRKLTKDYSVKFSPAVMDEINNFIVCQFSSQQIANKRELRDLQSFYSKSKF